MIFHDPLRSISPIPRHPSIKVQQLYDHLTPDLQQLHEPKFSSTRHRELEKPSFLPYPQRIPTTASLFTHRTKLLIVPRHSNVPATPTPQKSSRLFPLVALQSAPRGFVLYNRAQIVAEQPLCASKPACNGDRADRPSV